jgi:hypothetical protein
MKVKYNEEDETFTLSEVSEIDAWYLGQLCGLLQKHPQSKLEKHNLRLAPAEHPPPPEDFLAED